MNFVIDKQTLDDLNILGKFKNHSVFSLFCHTQTRGGERLLEQMFQNPLTDAVIINERVDVFEYFRQHTALFPVEQKLFEQAEHYLSQAGMATLLATALDTARIWFLHHIAHEQEYELRCRGIQSAFLFFSAIRNFVGEQLKHSLPSGYFTLMEELRVLFDDKKLNSLMEKYGNTRLSLWQVVRCHYSLCSCFREKFIRLMEIMYATDVYITVAQKAREYRFCKAVAYEPGKTENRIVLRGVFHPRLPDGVRNSICVNQEKNVIFLTGANMAGKSTLMKSFAIAVYMAHIGFPVAAEAMEFTIRDGLYTSINVSDNLNMGYSHFYAEVLRVKHVAEEVAQGKNLVVIFDELFKGTNVKDAFDATVAVTEAFCEYRNCSYIISTHILEAGLTLREQCDNFTFVYLPTIMRERIPGYTYRLEEGITSDRHGMMIINNEKIVEIIRGTKA